jgi:hypothetical protein
MLDTTTTIEDVLYSPIEPYDSGCCKSQTSIRLLGKNLETAKVFQSWLSTAAQEVEANPRTGNTSILRSSTSSNSINVDAANPHLMQN